MPNITNLNKYKASWQSWWCGLQPEWCLLNDGTFLQQDMGEQWVNLRQGGPNGFFLIGLAFAWWVKAMDGKVDNLGLHNALYDITWVVGCMADMPTPGVVLQRLWLHFGLSREPTPASLLAGPSHLRLQSTLSQLS